MPTQITPPPAISRKATVAIVATLLLGTGVFYTFRAPPTGLAPTGAVPVHRQENGSGSQVGILYDNNDERGSGSLVKQGNISGATLALGSAGDRKNRIACFGTGGALGFCQSNTAADCGCRVP